jgi:kynurenine formamidase
VIVEKLRRGSCVVQWAIPAHIKLLSAGVLILEMVNLRNIAPGGYTLICLPVGGLQPFRP